MAVPASSDGVADSELLRELILRDQLASVRDYVANAIPVNLVIGAIVAITAFHYGNGAKTWWWAAGIVVMSAIRLVQWLPSNHPQNAGRDDIARSLAWFCVTAFMSGTVWACISIFCDFYKGSQTMFYLTVVCGFTAGAITHGTPYALLPTCFILPPLLTVFGCLLYAGGFERDALAGTVLIYTWALIRFAYQSERGFRTTSRLKNQAVSLAHSLHEAHLQALATADEMRHRVAHDPLTGLLNRSGFVETVRRWLDGNGGPSCLMLLDLDGFKSVNDVDGEAAGDKVLVESARRLSEVLDPSFIIARMAGDEFAVFYGLSAALESPAELATRLITAIEVPFSSFDAGRLGACIGIHVGLTADLTEMLRCADEALRAAKASGRNRFYTFDDALRERLDMRRDVERDLQRALQEQAVEIWYQPIFDQREDRLIALEALLRWRHPRHGPIPPPELIRVAATSGLAEALLRHIIDQVCEMMTELSALGHAHLRVAMNVSPREVARLPVDDIVLSCLKHHRLGTAMLELEITEETTSDIRSVQDKLLRLAQSGVRIVIDDFGVGYSSLATLRQPYVSKIKIDYSFIRGVSKSPENQILVQAIQSLGRSLEMEVVAEGVETVEDLRWLEATGAHLVQGFYLKPPTPKKALLKWLQQQRVSWRGP